MKEWIEKNRTLVFIIFWGTLILIVYLFSGDISPDLSSRYESCESLTGMKRTECEQAIDLYFEQEEDYYQRKSFMYPR